MKIKFWVKKLMIIKNIIKHTLIGCQKYIKLARRFSVSSSKLNSLNREDKMKYILVTGGVISGVGKGVVASSFGTLLNCSGIAVTSLKIDPYINIDAGTFSPYEHGNDAYDLN